MWNISFKIMGKIIESTFEYTLVNLYILAKSIYHKNHSPIFYAHMTIWGGILVGFLIPLYVIVNSFYFNHTLNKGHWMILALIFVAIYYFTIEKRYNSEKAELLLKNYEQGKHTISKAVLIFLILLIAIIYVILWNNVRQEF